VAKRRRNERESKHRNSAKRWVIVSVLAAALVIGAGFAWLRTPNRTCPIAAGALKGANVLVVTIDTLRADYVGAYGSTRSVTPTIDRLAREGLRFDTTHTHVPLTLPSHTSILTGTYPFTSGVRDNGSFRFDGKRPTLATQLKAAGYATAAFVGAFVLDARFGLNAGFDLYDDRYGARPVGGELSLLERPAEQVIAPAIKWVSQHPRNTAWFVWVHLYDPHDPYDPPEPYRSRYTTDRYSGEIAYADAQLGVLLDSLGRGGQLEKTLVVVASDHGESLGEHGERTHGLFAYESTLRVPLVMWAPPTITPGTYIPPARLVDVAPTILDLLGVPSINADGRSLRPYIGHTDMASDPGSYFEAMNANLTKNWAPLTGIVSDGFKLIDLPIPELYDLAADPHELTNLYSRRPAITRALEPRLERISSAARAPVAGPVDAETQQRLRSLGYVVAPAVRSRATFTRNDDPKTLVSMNQRLDEALDALKAGSIDRSERLLKSLIAERSDFVVAHDRLAFLYRETGRLPAAIATLEAASRAGFTDAASLATLGWYLQESGALDRSAAVLETAIKMNPAETDAFEKLGVTYTRMGRFAEAERMFQHVLDIAPGSATTYNNLGSLYLTERRDSDAIAAFNRALAIDPKLANAHNGLGVAYWRSGAVDRAVAAWQNALKLRPDLADARDNLERAEREKKGLAPARPQSEY
jgi:arylsulfatase A-like enzyme/Tfp pilus assembly protein PilF